ncbi:hypothetical protein ACSDR0_44860 [Streptosporangium sp. G11]|uniref:hypothetical protein n=1 Tax=Streptosporangium sp. G11 TaxID=3436926 RepID=UPI003EBB150F
MTSNLLANFVVMSPVTTSYQGHDAPDILRGHPDSATDLLEDTVQQPWFIVAGAVIALAFIAMAAFIATRSPQLSARGVVALVGSLVVLFTALPPILTALYG